MAWAMGYLGKGKPDGAAKASSSQPAANGGFMHQPRTPRSAGSSAGEHCTGL